MSEVLLMLGIFAAVFGLGYLFITRVPQMLHTPLMSMTNAISAVTILGALVLFAVETSVFEKICGAAAIITAIFNVAGGFVITDRMLAMFRRRNAAPLKFSATEARSPSGQD